VAAWQGDMPEAFFEAAPILISWALALPKNKKKKPSKQNPTAIMDIRRSEMERIRKRKKHTPDKSLKKSLAFK